MEKFFIHGRLRVRAFPLIAARSPIQKVWDVSSQSVQVKRYNAVRNITETPSLNLIGELTGICGMGSGAPSIEAVDLQ